MQKDLLYCAIDVSKDKLDLDAAALALPAQLDNDQAGFRQLIKAAKKYPGAVQFVFEATGPYHLGLALALWEAELPLSVLNPATCLRAARAFLWTLDPACCNCIHGWDRCQTARADLSWTRLGLCVGGS